MDLTESYYELGKQYCIIARARRPEVAQHNVQQIITSLANHLGPYITTEDITYKTPNFIIHVNTAYAQKNILSEETFQTNDFKLDMVPWSKEHEDAQLPWMPAQAGLERTIQIGPLNAQPVVFSNDAHTGPCGLAIPDLSYLIIADTKSYYYSNHAMFCACKAKAAEIAAAVKHYTPEILTDAENLCESLRIVQHTAIDRIQGILRSIIVSFQSTAARTSIASDTVFEDMNSVSEGPHSLLNFDSYKRLPASIMMSVPVNYVRHLRMIHAEASKQAYGLESFFTTTQAPNGRYEIFRTVGAITSKYAEEPLRTPGSIETAAIYHSLKAITNWMGYKVIDVNYPSLANLMAALQRLDTQMVLLKCVAYNSSEHSNQLHAYLGELKEGYSLVRDNITETVRITEAMTKFNTIVHSYYHTIIKLSNEFFVTKAGYFAQHLDVPSPTTQPERWLTIQSEDGTYLPPQQW